MMQSLGRFSAPHIQWRLGSDVFVTYSFLQYIGIKAVAILPCYLLYRISPNSRSYMLLRSLARRRVYHRMRLAQLSAHMSNSAINGSNGTSHGSNGSAGVSLAELPKSNVFTSSLPPDPVFPTPAASHKAPRRSLGPRMVKGALYTYVRPEESKEPELLCVSERAMEDIGLRPGEEKTEEFKQMVAGNKFFWDESSGEGIYPWAQCYGGRCYHSSRLLSVLTGFRVAIVRSRLHPCLAVILTAVQWLLGRPAWRWCKWHADFMLEHV